MYQKISGKITLEKKTLNEVIKQFVIENQINLNGEIGWHQLRSFASGVANNLIGKNVDKRKLSELILQEVSKISSNEVESSTKNKSSQKLEKDSIFDVDRLDGNAFQNFMCKILKENGFTDVEVTGQAGDQGGDLLAKMGDEQLVIQAKRFSIDRKVTNSAVQEVIGAIAYYNANKGIVVTNSIYTQSAKELAKINNVELWNRDNVIEFLDVYNQKTSVD